MASPSRRRPGADWTVTQQAGNAQVRVDGYPPDGWIESSSNTVTDVIPGVTLNLQAAQQTGATPITVNLTRSTSQLINDLSNLVNIYNGIVNTIKETASYDPDTAAAGVLMGDAGLNDLLAQVRSVLTRPLAGFDSASETYTMAAQIGITIDRDGVLSLDADVLNEALADDYYGVLAAIGAVGTGASDSAFVQFNSAESSTEGGTYEVRVEFDAVGTVTAASIRKAGETEWRAATWDGNVITGAAGEAEQGLSVTFVWNASLTSPQTAEVRVQQGFGGALYDRLTDMLQPSSGQFAIKLARYSEAISDLDTRISAQEKRLEVKEELLRSKYARMEATLAQLDSFRAAYESLFSALDQTANRSSSSRNNN